MSRIATALLLAGVLFLVGAPIALAQQSVSGVVTDAETGEPLPGVNIIIQGTTTGAVTNLDGEYGLSVDGPTAVLVYSYVGYLTVEEVVGNRTTIDIAMAEDAGILGDIIVVGYGTQERGSITSSVSTVEVAEAIDGAVAAPTDFLEGRVAGLSIVETSGEPGADVQVQIRGGTSLASTNQPLYVIDGIPVSGEAVTPGGAGDVSTGPSPNPLTLINPNDIESVTVLKDASATAIYGSRGANGVILITTKGGREGSVTVDYEGNTAIASAANNYDLATASELRATVGRIDGQEAVDALGDANSDFLDEIFDTAITQNHNLSFAGGIANSQYRASVSYLNQEGIVTSSGQERVTGRLNANSAFLDGRLRLGLNLTSALTNNDFVPANATGGAEGGIFQNLIDFAPTRPVLDGNSPDGFFEQGGAFAPRNPVALAEQLDETARTTRTLGNLKLDLDIIDGLTATVNVGGDRSIGRRQGYFSRFSPVTEGVRGSAFQRDLERTSLTLQSYLTYDFQTNGPHSFDILAGYEYNEFDTQEFSVQGQGFISDVFDADRINAADELVVDGGAVGPGTFSFRTGYKLQSVLSRVNYSYNNRYFLTGVLRYDGSGRVAVDNEYQLFPAVSAGWRISEESFMRDVDFVTDLRLRAGFGIVGNQGLPSDYLDLALLAANPDFRGIFGGQVVTGVAPDQLANPDLKWEQKEEITVGLDYGFAAGRIFGSLEFYRNTTNDLLAQVQLISPAPVGFQVRNIGSLRNTGLEFSLDGIVIENEKTTFSVGAIFATNSNEILDLGGNNQIFTGTISGRGQSNQTALLLTPGQPFPVFYGAEFTGNYAENGNPLYNQYEDTDGDGFGDVIVGETELPGVSDYQIIGDPRPDFTYGLRLNLNVGRFGARAFFRGEQGRELFNNTALVYSTEGAALAGFNYILDDFPEQQNPNAPAVYSDRFIENASFLRLDQLTFEYNVPTDLFARFGAPVRNARVYVTGNNLFVITPYSGVDPEVNANAEANGIAAIGIDYLPYPRARTFTVGVSLGL